LPGSDRIELTEENIVISMERIDRLGKIAAALLESARLGEQRLDADERQFTLLRNVAAETNQRIGALVSFIGDYIRHDMEKRAD